MNKNLTWKLVLILAIVVVFTLGIFGIPKDWSKQGLLSAVTDRIHLGLDLKGGTHLILQVQVNDAVNVDSDNVIARLKEDMRTRKINYVEITKPDSVGHPDMVVVKGVAPEQRSDFLSIVNDRLPEYVAAAGAENSYTITMKAQMTPAWDALENRRFKWLNIIARLKPGVSTQQAEAAINPLWKSLRATELQSIPARSQRFREQFVEREFSELPVPFAAVATDLHSGQEIWLREGKVSAAIGASIAVPGLFQPVLHEDRYLVDGSVVNPVPVSLARAMGADIVIAVDLGSDLIGRYVRDDDRAPTPQAARRGLVGKLLPQFNNKGGESPSDSGPRSPSLLETLMGSINIMQVRIARSRLAGEPPDVLLTPRLGDLGLLDYHRAEVAIAEGREAVGRMLPAIRHAIPA